MKKTCAWLLALVMVITCFMPVVSLAAANTSFEAFDLKYSGQGMGGAVFRFVVNKTDIPFEVTDSNMIGLKVKGELVDGDKKIPFESKINKVEVRDSAVVLVVPQTAEVTTKDYSDNSSGQKHKFVCKIYPEVVSGGSGEAKKPEVSPSDLPRKEMRYKDNCVYYFLNYKNFEKNMGKWAVERSGAIPNMFDASKSSTAETELVVPYDYEYTIWGRSRDFASDRPKTRVANVLIDGTKLEGQLGAHGAEGYDWAILGKITLKQGSHKLSVDALGDYARFDMILVTDDASFKPVNAEGTLYDLVEKDTYDASKVVLGEKKKPEVKIDPNRPNTEIAVKFNDDWMKFDVDPVIINDRTLVPMRAIFEALGCEVSWDDETETAMGVRNGKVVMVTIGSNDASIAGKPVTIDQPPALINDRTMVPLRFISEAYGCEVEWEEKTQSVFITAEDAPIIYYVDGTGITELGSWTLQSDGYIQGCTDTANEGKGYTGGTPAKVSFNVTKPGKYKLWIRARDFATNKPGSRYFNVAFDGKEYPEKMGAHGKDGFIWTEAGVYDIQAGKHTVEILDTSGFYARCSGVLLTNDIDWKVPDNDAELAKYAGAFNATDMIARPTYPAYTKENIAVTKSESIENGRTKIVFYQGESSKGTVVQNEIYVKDSKTGEWVLVKGRNEEFGFLMMSALKANFKSGGDTGSFVGVTVNTKDGEIEGSTDDFFKYGIGNWLVPNDFTKVSDTEMKLSFAPNEKVNFSATFAFDDLVDDPKVTIDAKFNEKGAYSFMLASGDGVEKEQFDTVTAPMLHIKHNVPDSPVVLAECYLFTPMNTITLKADNNIKTPGRDLTTGVVIDPTCVSQHYAFPDTSEFGATFYTTGGKVRPQMVAPMMGNDNANFEAGEELKFSFRVINRFEDWYDSYKHIAVDMFNCKDIRTNYYGSINEEIYNIRDLIMDDFYGGWDPTWMGYYNMEGQNLVSQSNAMSVYQRYLLSEDEELLEKRVVPTIAYVLTRGSAHYAPDEKTSTSNYAQALSPLKGYIPIYNSAVYGGLYEMSQGRMPYLLDHALNDLEPSSIKAAGAFLKYTGDEKYKKEIIDLADKYLETYPNSPSKRDTRMVNGFVYGDYTTMTATLTAAYELTGEKKYLDKAEESGRLLMAAIWTTGYQNDYATTDYKIEPAKVLERLPNVDKAGYNFFWHGEQKWRPGNIDGEAKSAKQLAEEGKYTMEEETVPGWLLTQTGMGTEHPRTPGHGDVITMNNWLGTMVRLSVYTGDEWFETQARNAAVGRFMNYPGYYIDRYVASPYKADYPYKGADITSLYWHHIPIYLSLVEDFLINEAWAKSKQNINFPYVYQGGYAYFDSYQFGQAPGKFYDEDGMWLWMDKDIVTADNVNIDYVAAKKDGVAGIAFMNEDNAERTTELTLGSKFGAGVNTTATVFDAEGNKSTVEIKDSKFTLTIPSKGIMSVVISGLTNIAKPVYAKEYTYSNEVGQTVSAHVNGYGYVIQATDDKYWAYVYITDLPNNYQSAELTYTVGGETKKVVKDKYAYEWLIKVDDPNAEFTYSIEITKKDGTKESRGKGTLRTLANSTLKGTGVTVGQSSVPVAEDSTALKFDPFTVKYTAQGTGGGYIRLVVAKDQIPFACTKDMLKGVKATVVLTEVATGTEKTIVTSLGGNEVRADGSYTLLIKPTKDLPVDDYDNDKAQTHKLTVTLSAK